MERPWTRRWAVATSVVAVLGLLVGSVAGLVAAILLDPYQLFSTTATPLGERLVGGGLAALIVCAAATPAGLWAASLARRRKAPMAMGAAVAVVILATGLVYAVTASTQ